MNNLGWVIRHVNIYYHYVPLNVKKGSGLTGSTQGEKNSLIWPIPYVSTLILLLLICEFHICKILQCSVIKKEKCLIKKTTATGWLSLFIFIHVMLEKALHILKSYGSTKAVKIQSLYTSHFYIWVNQLYIYRFIKLFDSSLWHGGFSPQFVLITSWS